MKKYLCLLAILPLIACKNNNYEISGNIEQVADSSLVYLQVLQTDKSFKIIDSAYAINQKYTLKGNWEKEPTNAYLLIKEASFSPRFILEKGKINLSVINNKEHKYEINGTENNDLLNNLIQDTEKQKKSIISILSEANEHTISNEDRMLLYNEAFINQTDIDKTYFDFALKNPEKSVSALIVEDLYFRNSIDLNKLQSFYDVLDNKSPYQERFSAYSKRRVLSPLINTEFDIKSFADLAFQTDDFKSYYKDKTIIYFWNSYDSKNDQSFNLLNEIDQKTKGEIAIITFNVSVNQQKHADFVSKYATLYNFHLKEPNNKTLQELAKKYDLTILPKAFLLDKKGTILDVDSNLDVLVEDILNNLPNN